MEFGHFRANGYRLPILSLSLPKLPSSQILGVSWNKHPNPDEDPCSSQLFGQRARGNIFSIKKLTKHYASIENVDKADD